MIAATVGIAVLAMLVSASLLLSRSRPELAARLWPWNSLALASLAEERADPAGTARQLASARADAARALMLEPGNPVAARVLGTLAGAGGRDTAMLRALSYSEAMSRRDLMTQLVLIEVRVQRGDVAGALLHYDRALRTNWSAPVLLSTMIRASADPAIRRRVVGLLTRQPFWRPAFLVQLIDEQTSPDTVAGIIGALHLNPADPADRQLLAGAVGKLVGQGRVLEARGLIPRSATPIRNGGFGGDNAFPPLDWALSTDPELSATVETGPAAHGAVLFLDARNGRGGEVASQWLSLRPGAYRLLFVAGDVAGDEAGRPRWTISCGSDRSLGSAAVPASPPGGKGGAIAFTVPSGCPAQRLALSVASSDTGGARPWVDDVAVMPES